VKFRRVVLLGAFSIAMPFLHATSVRPLELQELVDQSHQIFVGKVVSIQEGVVPESNLNYTEYTFAVSDWVKGGSAKMITVRQLGRFNGVSQIPGLPKYKKGKETLLFIHRASQIGLTSPVGLHQGHFPIEKSANGERFVLPGRMNSSLLKARLQSGSPAAKSATSEGIPENGIRLTEFLTVLRQIR
jgi:hypothetical protein